MHFLQMKPQHIQVNQYNFTYNKKDIFLFVLYDIMFPKLVK